MRSGGAETGGRHHTGNALSTKAKSQTMPQLLSEGT
jgi:hypothetical protein